MWRALKIAGAEVGMPLPRMPLEEAKGWHHGDMTLVEITDPNDRATAWQTVQVVGLTEAGKQLALMLTSAKTTKLAIRSKAKT
jgi:hypothetical protein